MSEPKKRNIKVNGYSRAVANAKKRKRQQDALDKQAVRAKMTVAEKIALAKSRRGNSKREIARLIKQLTNEPNSRDTSKHPRRDSKV